MGVVDLKMPVLIVDEYQTMLRTMGNYMRQIGFEDVDEANDGHQALDKLRRKAYGLVISDCMMQPMTGFDLIRHMRASADLADVRVVLVSSETGEETIAAAKQAGASDCLVKPFCASALKDRLAAILGEP